MQLNHVVLSGNLTRDPEMTTTPSGTSVLRFGIAVDERRPNGSGQYEQRANFFEVVAFGKTAEGVRPYLRKGGKVAVDGKLHYDSWERDGKRFSKVEVWAHNIDLPPKPRQPAAAASAPTPPPAVGAEDYFDTEFDF